MQNSTIPLRDCSLIMNTDVMGNSGIHWVAVVIKGKNVYIYDSFARRAQNLLRIFSQRMVSLGFKVHNSDLTDADQFSNTSVDCGHRSISALMLYRDYGIKTFMRL